jgi:molybdopterin converting factor small subunit
MITVRCLGHIATSVGKEELLLDASELPAGELLDRLAGLAGATLPLGFDRYNTLIMVEQGEAFLAAHDDRILKSGDKVVLIPVSHGG